MKINEALAKAIQALDSPVDERELLGWLCEIENIILLEIAGTHEAKHAPSGLLCADSDRERELFVPEPYCELYINYLLMKADLWLHDSARYVNSASVFASSYTAFADWYNRENMPNQKSRIAL